jgi:hypothetical protein
VGVSGQTLLALALPGFAGQDMAVAGLFELQAAGACRFEALGRAPVRFNFGHNLSSVPQYFLFQKRQALSWLSKGILPVSSAKPSTLIFNYIILIYNLKTKKWLLPEFSTWEPRS